MSNDANQPFNIGGYSLVFNGEIYNYKELSKKYLYQSNLRTSSDTEVLASLLSENGLSILNKLNGMFAFAWYDPEEKKLTLVRDRFGVKPLFYMQHQGNFYFSSELKPLLKQKGDYQFNPDSLSNLICHTATDYNENTPIQGIYQLSPGSYLTIDIERKIVSKQSRWYYFEDYKSKPSYQNYHEFTSHFENLLIDSIGLRLRSDVPVGLTLSGGLDSSVIYTLAKEKFNIPLKCFTATHLNSPTDESHLVRRLVSEYGDKLILIEDSSRYDLFHLKEALYSLEFPIWNNSCITYDSTYSAIKENSIRVILEGHGSDEQLGGYPYMIREAYYTLLKNKKLLKAINTRKVYQETLNNNLNQTHYEDLGWLWRDLIKPKARKILKGKSGLEKYNFNETMRDSFDFKILPIVLRTFDRLTMKHSIESRAPFMDYRIVEFLRDAPLEYKITSIGSKAPLRDILKKYRKDYIYKEKRKMGFASNVPLFYSSYENKKIIEKYIQNSFLQESYPQLCQEATKAIQHSTINWVDTESIWKVLSLSMIKEIYNDILK